MADYADKHDSQSLPGILTKTVDNLKPHKIKIKEAVADCGYSSGDVLRFLEFQGINGYIPNFGGYKPSREGFDYDPVSDQYTCQMGIKITYRKTYTDKKGNWKKQYRSSRTHCNKCPIKAACIGNSFEKKIEHTADRDYYERMNERMLTHKAKILRKIRQSTVEPVLGTLLNFMNMRRVNTRGIELAYKHVLLAASVYNLKKYMNYIRRKTKVEAMAAIELPKNAFSAFISLRFELFYLLLRLSDKNTNIYCPVETYNIFEKSIKKI